MQHRLQGLHFKAAGGLSSGDEICCDYREINCGRRLWPISGKVPIRFNEQRGKWIIEEFLVISRAAVLIELTQPLASIIPIGRVPSNATPTILKVQLDSPFSDRTIQVGSQIADHSAMAEQHGGAAHRRNNSRFRMQAVATCIQNCCVLAGKQKR